MSQRVIVYLAFALIIYSYNKEAKLKKVITIIFSILLAGYVFVMESNILNVALKQILNSVAVLFIAWILLRRLYIRKKG